MASIATFNFALKCCPAKLPIDSPSSLSCQGVGSGCYTGGSRLTTVAFSFTRALVHAYLRYDPLCHSQRMSSRNHWTKDGALYNSVSQPLLSPVSS